MRYSSTIQSDPFMKMGSSTRLTCECGWEGAIRELAKLEQYNRAGELLRRSYLCNRHLKDKSEIVVLLEDKFEPALGINEQANGQDQRK